MKISLETSCPWLAARWDREVRGVHPSEENACYLWDECGVPPDVVQYCAGTLPWHGEKFVPVPVETQWSICLTEYYGSCRWLRERQWYTREQTLVCPLLGSQHDRLHKHLYPSAMNHCHSLKGEPDALGHGSALTGLVGVLGRGKARFQRGRFAGRSVPAEKQSRLCLTGRFSECELYRHTLPER